MAMPRPKGKVLSIAKKTVPYLRNMKKAKKNSKTESKSDVESKIVDINEHLSKKSKGLFS